MTNSLFLALALFLGATSSDDARTKESNWHRYIALGAGRTWVLINTQAKSFKALILPDGIVPQDLVVSRDGKLVAMTAPFNQGRTSLLLWNEDPKSLPLSVGESIGYHSQPQFSYDGRTIYFAHSPRAGAKPMQHSEGAFAQVYRVNIDGTHLEALTDEFGCHFSPFRVGTQLNYVHSSCRGPKREIVSGAAWNVPKRARPSVIETERPIDEIDVSPDGTSGVASYQGNTTTLVVEIDMKTGLDRTVEDFRTTEKPRAQYGTSRDEIYFWRSGKVWLHTAVGDSVFWPGENNAP